MSAPYDKNNPFPACLVDRRRLSSPASQKDTQHFSVSLAGSGLTYKCGDSLGVFPTNNPQAVAALLQAAGFSGDEQVTIPKDAAPISLRQALSKAWMEQREFIDLFLEHPSARPSAQEVIELMRKLMPRLYSISSAPSKYPQEIHLTVAVVRYETNGRPREGVCSSYLADRARMHEADLPVFVADSHFGLPADDNLPVIMVGPGTGVAPFRSFVMDRATRGAKGPNWLFFGDQRKDHDFLYADEWAEYQKSGVLTRLDTAFSRDQAAKVYVQDRMRENAAELWKWIQQGAYFYVCGDAKRMAKDVDAALHAIVAEQGGMTPEAAVDWVKQFKKDGRYQRDVY